MKKPIITLLTDFGSKDHYVASMKGVILNINPQCTLVDIAHEVRPHDIEGGAFMLANTYSYFPKGTIHLSVVDPGVGGKRRAILLVTRNYFFIGPDNGLFTFVAEREDVKQIVVLTKENYFLSRISLTFHGRDIFAPVAAHLSLGIKPKAFGNKTSDFKKLTYHKSFIKEGKLMGEIFHIDTFGNLVTNIDEEKLFQFIQGRPFAIRVGRTILRSLKKGYWEGTPEEGIGLIGSGGFLEISVSEGNAQKTLKVKRGDSVQIEIEPKGRRIG